MKLRSYKADYETAMEKFENMKWLSSIDLYPNNTTHYIPRELLAGQQCPQNKEVQGIHRGRKESFQQDR